MPLFLSFVLTAMAQRAKQPETPMVYQATPERINDLVHTKLEAKFDYQQSQLNGKVCLIFMLPIP